MDPSTDSVCSPSDPLQVTSAPSARLHDLLDLGSGDDVELLGQAIGVIGHPLAEGDQLRAAEQGQHPEELNPRHRVPLGRVDRPDRRVDEVVGQLPVEGVLSPVPERLGVVAPGFLDPLDGRSPGADHLGNELHRAELGPPGERLRPQEVPAEMLAVDPVDLAPAGDSQAEAAGHELIGEPGVLRQPEKVAVGGGDEECAVVDEEAVAPAGAQLAPRPLGGLQHADPMTRLLQPKRGGEPRGAAADDDQLRQRVPGIRSRPAPRLRHAARPPGR